MTKNALKASILFLFFTILLVAAFNFKKKQTDELTLEQYSLNTNFSPLTFPEKRDNLEIQSLLITISQEQEINFLKRVLNLGPQRDLNNEVMHDKNINEVDFFLYTVRPSILFRQFQRQPAMILTGDHYASPNTRYKDYFPLNSHHQEATFSIRHLAQADDEQMGYYYLETTDAQLLDTYLLALAVKYNQTYGTDFGKKDFLSTETPEPLEISNNIKLKEVFIFSLVFLLIILLIWLLDNTKRMTVYSLNGNSVFTIIRKTFFYPVLAVMFLAMAISYLFLLEIKSFDVLVTQFFLSALFLLVVLLALLVTRKLSLRNQLNQKSYTQKLIIPIFLLKFLLLFLSLTNFSQLSDLFFTVIEPSSKLSAESEKYAVLFPMFIGKDYQALINHGNGQYNVDDTELYNHLDNQGMLILETTNYFSSPEDGPLEKAITVNTNYLEKYPVINTLGETIKIDKMESAKVVLIPEKFSDNYNEIAEYYAFAFQEAIEDIDFYLIKDKQNIKTFDPKHPVITNPNVIRVQTQKNSTSNRRHFISGGSYDGPVFVNVEQTAEETYQELLPMLKKATLDDNFTSLVPLQDVRAVELIGLVGDVKTYAFDLIVALIFVYTLISYITLMYFNQNKIKFSIMRLNGLSFIRTYWPILTATVLQYFLMFLVIFKNYSDRILFSSVLFLLLEVSVLTFTILRLEKATKYTIIEGK